MLLDFFYTLRSAKLPVSVKEYLTLLEALQKGVVGPNTQPADGETEVSGYSMDDFYFLARTTLVKDEKHYDKFDRAFGAYFKGIEQVSDFTQGIPAEWLRKNLERFLTPEEQAKLQAMGWNKLMETLKKRLEEQKERHEGGSKWIGTGGTSPFGAYGHNPQGIRIGQDKSRNRSAVKVWDQRAYQDYDDTQELGTRNIKVALRRLRKFAREGHEDELDLHETISKTAANAGFLDIKMRPERHNKVKVLLLMDVGGSMDDHIQRVEELFSAAKTEFKHLEFYYFHNCVYDYMWKNNRRRFAEKFDTWDIIRKYNKDYKLIFVGDATMSPYEILQPGGSVEYHNEEPG
ncbi:MAG: VWA domain-containing protein, partial [Rhodoferax sp.]|nr:VWA domain-containing protein [Rhodoferax sp.]